MRHWLAAAAFSVVASHAMAESTPRQDAMLEHYFALWDDNAAVTPENVARLYAPQVVYYGHPMTRADLYRDKRDFIRRWPQRRYAIEPGTASKTCGRTQTTCVFSAILDWHTIGARGARSGRSRVSLTVSPGDGGLKIVREGAVTLDR